ncbi:zinc-ribbon domain-containing protein [uncultured Methanobrevibacter sp.]|uniref:zinc-ribbon domain-containing protein n=1 Tax=uncultured Methanobrevibacter sp. TaxID=253161 RepID=UPI002600D114|nr:zinc-ribbon domain-containing protein [uncultured Methanobrevibacter sp.]
MSKKCPECGESVPQEAHFCANCGYDFFRKDSLNSTSSKSSSGIFSDGKIFLVLIAIVIIVGAGVVISMGFGGGNHNNQADDTPKHEVDLTITDVNGWDSDGSSKKSYSLYTEAIFNKVPSDLKGYNIRTVYMDENNTQIGQETETLANVYYDTDYPISFAYYTTFKKPNPDHVNVEIIKDGKVIDNFTSIIDKTGIDYLN